MINITVPEKNTDLNFSVKRSAVENVDAILLNTVK